MSRAWMPLYVADYLADTGHLTTAEHGAYLLLIMHYWSNGGLPDDEHRLARIARMTAGEWADARITLKGFFDDNWTHKRIDGELSKARSKTELAKNNGTFGAVAKWGSTQSTDNRLKRSERLANARRLGRHSPEEWQALLSLFDGCVKCGSTEKIVKDHIKPIYQGGSDGIDNLQPLCHSCNSSKGPDNTDYRSPNWRERLAKRLANASLPQSQSQLSFNEDNKTREARSLAVQAAFDAFWRRWPHKVGKPAAEKAFAKVSGEIEAILLGIDSYIRDKPPDRPWLNPATFLNQRRWEDAPAETFAAIRQEPPRKISAITQAIMNLEAEINEEKIPRDSPSIRQIPVNGEPVSRGFGFEDTQLPGDIKRFHG